MNIASLGWGEALAETFQPHADAGLRPGRVAIQHRGAYVLLAEEGEVWANVTGRLRHAADSTADLPAVGDWVAYDFPPGVRASVGSGDPAPQVGLPPKAGRARDRRAGGRRQRRRPLSRHVAQPGPERPPDRALHDAGVGERRRPGRRPHEGRPVPRRRAGPGAGRVGHVRRAGARHLGADRRRLRGRRAPIWRAVARALRSARPALASRRSSTGSAARSGSRPARSATTAAAGTRRPIAS